MAFFEQVSNGILYRDNGETLLIEPWGMDSFRVRSKILGEMDDSSVALLPQGACETSIVLNEEESSITNGKIKAVLSRRTWGGSLQISFYNQRGELLIRECSNGGALQKRARHFKQLPGGEFRLKATFEAPEDEKIYGMGQYQQEIMNLKGCNLELAHRNSQASVPFYISSAGYGFLWHNAAIGEVNFGLNTTQWVAEATEGLDYWITAGDTPAEIERRFAEVVGKTPMMPEYGLGFWQCKLRYYNQEQVIEVASEYKKREIPVDVFVIDYYHWPRCGDYRFDEEYFPNPKEMVDKLHELGMETMVSIWPQIDWRSENYNDMRQKGLLVKSNCGIDVQMLFHGNNVFLDATNPRTREYVWNRIKKNYGDLGIKTYWLDEAEPEFTTYDFDHYRYHAGPVARIGNIYPREYSRMFYEGQKSDGQDDIVNLVRCAWVGSQKYGALVWSGDIMSNYEDFRKQICVGIHMGIAGIPWWTTDIGGFHGGWIENPGFKELVVRWFEYGTFCPVMRLHGCRQPGQQIVNKAGEVREWTGADNEIWSYGEENYEIMKKYIFLREAMRPYTRSLMEDAHKHGNPVIRAMFYEFPEDKECWDLKDQYMFGDKMLVAPICHEGTFSRSVYLPKGASWTELSTGTVYEGGKTYEIEAPIEVIPVFLKDGQLAELIGMI